MSDGGFSPVHIDYGVLESSANRIDAVAEDLSATSSKAAGSTISPTSFGLLNVALGAAVAPLSAAAADIIHATSLAAQALATGVKAAKTDFENVDTAAATGYAQATADVEASGRLR
ncbi:type VII secretion target [Microbacterium sp. Marseille-Q6965]|uniref:type VII secretion target n=1 Tax=Microbacterium sp. Marseille-Q6965 TaxID=2965072 RepID=UPI0021B7BB23|nr:type VII secretion target [Microbacterium sp. Marseille-Q6965]